MTGLAEYNYTEKFTITDDVKQTFDDRGYILLRFDDISACMDTEGHICTTGLLSKEEINKVLKVLTDSDAMMKETYEVEEASKDKHTQRIIWSHPGSDVTGIISRSEKVAGTCQKLLGGEVYHYHSKMLLKGAHTGAQHHWHQDYGYWYNNGCLFPDMMTVFIALDKCTKENSCLQILDGSHKCGRIDHHPMKSQMEADLVRKDEIAKHCPHHYVELEPGDALFFHCNVLHHSDDNNSDLRRWVYICTYNKASNNPVKEHHHPRYTPMTIVSNTAIMECENYTDMSGKDFIHPMRNKTLLEYKESGKDKS